MGNQTPPPTYKVMEMIAPPDYTDALQDVLVSQTSRPSLKEEGGEPTGETGEGMAEIQENEVHTHTK